METVEILIVAYALIGSFLNAHKRVEGFYFWMSANALGVRLFFDKGLYGMAFLYFVYFLLAIYAIFIWKKK